MSPYAVISSVTPLVIRNETKIVIIDAVVAFMARKSLPGVRWRSPNVRSAG